MHESVLLDIMEAGVPQNDQEAQHRFGDLFQTMGDSSWDSQDLWYKESLPPMSISYQDQVHRNQVFGCESLYQCACFGQGGACTFDAETIAGCPYGFSNDFNAHVFMSLWVVKYRKRSGMLWPTHFRSDGLEHCKGCAERVCLLPACICMCPRALLHSGAVQRAY